MNDQAQVMLNPKAADLTKVDYSYLLKVGRG